MEIYVFLVYCLGISCIKWELEDLFFCYLNEMEFYKIFYMMSEKCCECEELVDIIVDKIRFYIEE